MAVTDCALTFVKRYASQTKNRTGCRRAWAADLALVVVVGLADEEARPEAKLNSDVMDADALSVDVAGGLETVITSVAVL